MIELKRIKSKQTNYLPLMNQSVSMPSFPVTTISTSGTKLFTQKNQNGTRSHTGVYVYYHSYIYYFTFFTF